MTDVRKKTLLQSFKPGDTLFGTSSGRAKFMYDLKKVVGQFPITIDKTTTPILENVSEQKDPDSPKTFSSTEDNAYAFSSIEEKAYVEELKNGELPGNNGVPSQSILARLTRWKNVPRPHYQTEGISKLSLENNNFPITPASTEKNLSIRQRLERRGCKAELLSPEPGTINHFYLDDLDLLEIFDRKNSRPMGGSDVKKCVYDSYTSAEFRFVLKNYDEIKKHTVFYKKEESDEERHEIRYVQCDLFDWIAEQKIGKNELFEWAKLRAEGLHPKITEATFDKIVKATKTQPQSESSSSSSSSKDENRRSRRSRSKSHFDDRDRSPGPDRERSRNRMPKKNEKETNLESKDAKDETIADRKGGLNKRDSSPDRTRDRSRSRSPKRGDEGSSVRRKSQKQHNKRFSRSRSRSSSSEREESPKRSFAPIPPTPYVTARPTLFYHPQTGEMLTKKQATRLGLRQRSGSDSDSD